MISSPSATSRPRPSSPATSTSPSGTKPSPRTACSPRPRSTAYDTTPTAWCSTALAIARPSKPRSSARRKLQADRKTRILNNDRDARFDAISLAPLRRKIPAPIRRKMTRSPPRRAAQAVPRAPAPARHQARCYRATGSSLHTRLLLPCPSSQLLHLRVVNAKSRLSGPATAARSNVTIMCRGVSYVIPGKSTRQFRARVKSSLPAESGGDFAPAIAHCAFRITDYWFHPLLLSDFCLLPWGAAVIPVRDSPTPPVSHGRQTAR